MTRFVPILLLLAVSLVATGCGSAPAADALTEAELHGEWEATQASVQLAGFAGFNVLGMLRGEDRTGITFQPGGSFEAYMEVEEPRSLGVPGVVSIPVTDGGFSGTYAILDETHMRFAADEEPVEAVIEYRYQANVGGMPQLVLHLRNAENSRAALAFLLQSEELAALITGAEVTLRPRAAASL